MSAALDKALSLIDEAARDPVAAVRHASAIASLLRRAKLEGPSSSALEGDRLAAVLERIDARSAEASALSLAALGVSHIVRPDVARPLSAASPETGPDRVEWPAGEGLVRSLFAGTMDGNPANLARVSVRISVDGTDDLFTTGSAPAWVPLVALQAGNNNWFRLGDKKVTSLSRWQVAFRYEGAAAGPQVVTPYVLFGFSRRH